MKRLILNRDDEEDDHATSYAHDIGYMVEICRARGYIIDRRTAQEAWEKHSDSMAAGWMMLDMFDDREENEEYIFRTILGECKVEEE